MLRGDVPPIVEVVLNRNARRLREGSALSRSLTVAAGQSGARLHVTTSLEELDEVARGIASRAPDSVILAGGDGSCMAGLSALTRAYAGAPLPHVAIAPGGTVSTIARNLGLGGAGRAERVVGAVLAGSVRAVHRPTLRVRDDKDERVGFIFGAGLVSHFFTIYEASPRRGLTRAAQIAARVFAGSFVGGALAERVLAPVHCKIGVDGAVHPAAAWSLIVASVLRDVGLHFLVTYRAASDRERFHVVASGLAPRELGPQLPRVLAGRPLRGEPRIDALATAVQIDFAEEDGAYVLDGDFFVTRKVTVAMGPLITVLLPA